MSTFLKKILLVSGTLIVLIIVILTKKHLKEKASNKISYNDIIVQNEEVTNTSSEIEKIKVHVTGEVNNPRSY